MTMANTSPSADTSNPPIRRDAPLMPPRKFTDVKSGSTRLASPPPRSLWAKTGIAARIRKRKDESRIRTRLKGMIASPPLLKAVRKPPDLNRLRIEPIPQGVAHKVKRQHGYDQRD